MAGIICSPHPIEIELTYMHKSRDAMAHPAPTLASGIDVGPTFIKFGLLSRLIREYIKVI